MQRVDLDLGECNLCSLYSVFFSESHDASIGTKQNVRKWRHRSARLNFHDSETFFFLVKWIMKIWITLDDKIMNSYGFWEKSKTSLKFDTKLFFLAFHQNIYRQNWFWKTGFTSIFKYISRRIPTAHHSSDFFYNNAHLHKMIIYYTRKSTKN